MPLMPSVSNSSKHWQPLLDDTTLANYSTLLHTLARAIITSVSGGGGEYKFPLTERSKTACAALVAALDDPDSEPALRALHAFIYPFLAAREILGCYSRWDEVLDCFLAGQATNLHSVR